MKNTWPCIAVAAGALKFQACRYLDSSARVSQAAASIAAHCSTAMIAMQNRSFKRPSSIVPSAICLFLLFNAYSAHHRRWWLLLLQLQHVTGQQVLATSINN